MSRGRHSVAAGAILLAALTFTGLRQVRAQEQPPNLQMLLNLDLFSSSGTGDSGYGDSGTGGSMLDQIQALRQMGYLQSTHNGEPFPPSGPPPSEFIPSPKDLPSWLLEQFGGER
jgi:hypothetical protein